jgi:hypothetical protein
MQHSLTAAHFDHSQEAKTVWLESSVSQIVLELGVDWNKVSYEEFTSGFHAEATHFLEHDLCEVLAHETLRSLVLLVLMRLEEVPDYYTRVAQMEAEGRAYYWGVYR